MRRGQGQLIRGMEELTSGELCVDGLNGEFMSTHLHENLLAPNPI